MSDAHGDLLATFDGEVLLRDVPGGRPALELVPRDHDGVERRGMRVRLSPPQARYLALVLLRYADEQGERAP